MAARYGAGQYEDAFSPHRLQNWSVPRPGRQRPLLREGSTLIVADDRGHLLPDVPRSQASPWGMFVGTWEMPLRIPPARLDLTSRSAAAAGRLTAWIRQPTALTCARNGLRTDITGKPQEPRSDVRTITEPSRRSRRAPSEGIHPTGPALEEPPGPAGPTAPGSHQPSRVGVRQEGDPSPQPLAALQPSSQQDKPGSCQPAVTDPHRGDARSPQIPASVSPGASPRQAAPVASPGGKSPGLRALRA